MNTPVTDVKKYDINRRIYLPKWVEEELEITPGSSYVTFVQNGEDVVIKRVSISIA
jgi:bifunctional DNA-binding transcriptional regulator/antitoxin component of YhaV-PrlF toxin-antitoxin module